MIFVTDMSPFIQYMSEDDMSCTDIDASLEEALYSLRGEENITLSRLSEITKITPYALRHAAARLEACGFVISHRYGRLSLSLEGEAHVRDRLSRYTASLHIIRSVGFEDEELAHRMAEVLPDELIRALESKICLSEATLIAAEEQNSPKLLQLRPK